MFRSDKCPVLARYARHCVLGKDGGGGGRRHHDVPTAFLAFIVKEGKARLQNCAELTVVGVVFFL